MDEKINQLIHFYTSLGTCKDFHDFKIVLRKHFAWLENGVHEKGSLRKFGKTNRRFKNFLLNYFSNLFILSNKRSSIIK